MTHTLLPTAAANLLLAIADHDDGTGVRFNRMPYGRYGHPHTGQNFNRRTFHPLVRNGLIDVGDSDDTPVRITDAGRSWISTRNGNGQKP